MVDVRPEFKLRCETCHYWDGSAGQTDMTGGRIGACCAKPPQVVVVEVPDVKAAAAKAERSVIAISKRDNHADDEEIPTMQAPLGAFPVTRGSQWCGDYAPLNPNSRPR